MTEPSGAASGPLRSTGLRVRTTWPNALLSSDASCAATSSGQCTVAAVRVSPARELSRVSSAQARRRWRRRAPPRGRTPRPGRACRRSPRRPASAGARRGRAGPRPRAGWSAPARSPRGRRAPRRSAAGPSRAGGAGPRDATTSAPSRLPNSPRTGHAISEAPSERFPRLCAASSPSSAAMASTSSGAACQASTRGSRSGRAARAAGMQAVSAVAQVLAGEPR